MKDNFKKLTGFVPLEIAEVGDYVQFGKIAWKVIAMEGDKKLLLSKECLGIDMDWELGRSSFEELFNEIAAEHAEEDIKQNDIDDEWGEDIIDRELAYVCSEDYFNKKYRGCNKEYENIQKYLREWFIKEYFSQDDIERIVPYSIKVNDQIVSDYALLLSQDEVKKYIPQKEDRIGTIFNLIDKDIAKPWILRFNNTERYYFYVDTIGEIVFGETDRYPDKFRPAVWVK